MCVLYVIGQFIIKKGEINVIIILIVINKEE